MTAVCVVDCDCRLLSKIGMPGLKVDGYRTESDACEALYSHWVRYLQDPDRANRYVCVHGPRGHLIGIKGSPIGDLPPRPPPYP